MGVGGASVVGSVGRGGAGGVARSVASGRGAAAGNGAGSRSVVVAAAAIVVVAVPAAPHCTALSSAAWPRQSRQFTSDIALLRPIAVNFKYKDSYLLVQILLHPPWRRSRQLEHVWLETSVDGTELGLTQSASSSTLSGF